MLRANFLLTWPNKKPKCFFLLLVYNWMPISVKMFAALIHFTHLCCFNGYVWCADYIKNKLFSMHFLRKLCP